MKKDRLEIIIRGPMGSGKTALAHYLSKVLAQLWKIEVKVEDAPGDMEARDGFTPEQRLATLNAVRDKTEVTIRTEQVRRIDVNRLNMTRRALGYAEYNPCGEVAIVDYPDRLVRDKRVPESLYRISYMEPVPPTKNVIIDDLRTGCDCGAAKCKTTHADWCSTQGKS
jgi:hypothetical protein